MKPTSDILRRIQCNSKLHQYGIYTRLYRYLLREDIYLLAYKKLYKNKGLGTKGIDDDTADSFGAEYVSSIIDELLYLLCCSEKHINAVFDMLKRQKHRPDFRGGIEAKLLKSWHIDLLKEVKPKQIFFAYDTPYDLPPLEHAARLFKRMQVTAIETFYAVMSSSVIPVIPLT